MVFSLMQSNNLNAARLSDFNHSTDNQSSNFIKTPHLFFMSMFLFIRSVFATNIMKKSKTVAFFLSQIRFRLIIYNCMWFLTHMNLIKTIIRNNIISTYIMK